MGISVAITSPRAESVEFSVDTIVVSLSDGRVISAPLTWFPQLLKASENSRNNWELLGDGEGIHWPEADEDLSVPGLLLGTPAYNANIPPNSHT